VVLITTKRGRGAAGDQLRRLLRPAEPVARIDLLNAEQYMEIYNEGCRARYGITYDCN
jgi:hypothetical protein